MTVRSSKNSRHIWKLKRREVIGIIALGVGALALVGLRTHILRLRYALGYAIEEETMLLEKERQARANFTSLRDPKRLTGIARKLGFEKPKRVIRLSDIENGLSSP